MNYFLQFLVQYRQSTEYRVQTESNAYETTVQFAQVGSKSGGKMVPLWRVENSSTFESGTRIVPWVELSYVP